MHEFLWWAFRSKQMEEKSCMVDAGKRRDEQGVSQLQRAGKCLPPFLSKTYELVDRSGAEHVVSWNEEGTAFVVWLPEDLSQFLLPKYFKHCNFSSFIRQLNTYGFRKSASDRWEFRHEKFQKGKAHLLGEITRRKCEPSIYPSHLKAREKGTVIEDSHLLEENKILQRENSELLLQIARYKALQSELMNSLPQFMASNKKARLLS
uniref:Heat stress transcription factor B-4 n=1 Tax=Anthurium amnicola TaxID=1678845 RepID=A0A1D1YKW8_9ARAE